MLCPSEVVPDCVGDGMPDLPCGHECDVSRAEVVRALPQKPYHAHLIDTVLAPVLPAPLPAFPPFDDGTEAVLAVSSGAPPPRAFTPVQLHVVSLT